MRLISALAGAFGIPACWITSWTYPSLSLTPLQQCSTPWQLQLERKLSCGEAEEDENQVHTWGPTVQPDRCDA